MTLIPYQAKDEMELANAYPINKMRNDGLDEVKTSHVLLIDADFIPSVGLDDGVQKAIQETRGIRMKKNSDRSKNTRGDDDYHHFALVVPAFERALESRSYPCEDMEDCIKFAAQNPEFMPRSMKNLNECVNGENHAKCIVFNSVFNSNGHFDTKSDEWLKKMDKENITPISCISERYEPYIVIPWCPSQHDNYGTDSEGILDINIPLSPYYDER